MCAVTSACRDGSTQRKKPATPLSGERASLPHTPTHTAQITVTGVSPNAQYVVHVGQRHGYGDASVGVEELAHPSQHLPLLRLKFGIQHHRCRLTFPGEVQQVRPVRLLKVPYAMTALLGFRSD